MSADRQVILLFQQYLCWVTCVSKWTIHCAPPSHVFSKQKLFVEAEQNVDLYGQLISEDKSNYHLTLELGKYVKLVILLLLLLLLLCFSFAKCPKK